MAAGRPFHGSFVAIPRSPLCSALSFLVHRGDICLTKDDVGWIFVRAFGVYFLAQMLWPLLGLGPFLLRIEGLYEMAAMDASFSVKAESQIMEAWIHFGFTLAELILFLLLAYYCLRRGTLVHKMICYRPHQSKS